MGGSGHADYSDANNKQYGTPVEVPLIRATAANIKEYGRFVTNFEEEEVWITQWPQHGWRSLCPGTGNCGGVASGLFMYKWEGDFLKALNKAVPDGDYVTGCLPSHVKPDNRTHVLVREANYHADGGQVFFPMNGDAFVAVLALPTDDVKPENFVAFYFDGSCGLQIKANIWHQPLYPLNNEAVFQGKQGAVYACVVVDFVDEFGKYLSVPLKEELIKD